MLTLTDNARVAIESILAGAPSPESAGLRFAMSPTEENALALSIVAQPDEGDKVVGDAGARVFLDSAAASVLDDKVLDAQAGATGNVEFRLSTQG